MTKNLGRSLIVEEPAVEKAIEQAFLVKRKKKFNQSYLNKLITLI